VGNPNKWTKEGHSSKVRNFSRENEGIKGETIKKRKGAGVFVCKIKRPKNHRWLSPAKRKGGPTTLYKNIKKKTEKERNERGKERSGKGACFKGLVGRWTL